jgi:sodium-dependent dicarboxylate transporter 2/3/5
VDPLIRSRQKALEAVEVYSSTPPNAIAYSSGHVPIGKMIKYGVGLSLTSCALIITLVTAMASWLF